MNPRTLSIAILIASIALPLGAQAQFQPWAGSSILDDPDWRKSFLGSYGFLSGAEPEVRANELELLREVIDVMKVNPEAAAAMLQQQTSAESSASLDFVLANLQFQNGQLDGAVATYESAIEKFPDFRRAHKNLGLLRVQQGSCGPALSHLSRALELGDRDGRTFGLMGYCQLEAQNHFAAEVAYRNAILQQPDTRDWKLGLARALLAMNHYQDAVALFGDLLEGDPEDARLWMLQANAYIGLEEPLAAAVNLEAVRMLGKAEVRSLVLLGDIYMNAEMYEGAKSAYLEVVERDLEGSELEAVQRAAEILIRTHAHREAGALLESIEHKYAADLDVDGELQLLTLQAKLARAEGHDEKAAKLLESVVERDGMRGDALLELAAYYAGKGDTERAVLTLDRTKQLEQYEYRALLEHAQLMVSEREYAIAADLLRSALRIQSEPRVEAFLARVEQAIPR